MNPKKRTKIQRIKARRKAQELASSLVVDPKPLSSEQEVELGIEVGEEPEEGVEFEIKVGDEFEDIEILEEGSD